MIVLAGADLVLPDRIATCGSLTIDGEQIVEVAAKPRTPSDHGIYFDLTGRYIVPGFVDVHVHGVEGTDSLDGVEAIDRIADRLPRYGVTAFCPTTVACAPATLRTFLAAVRAARTRPVRGRARVLASHLESNFINPEYRGAQPADCLRTPVERGRTPFSGDTTDEKGVRPLFTGADILAEIARARPDVGIVTLAPELDGGIDLVRELVALGHHVSLGHSGATFEQALAAVAAGARQATHLFNRMPPLRHREPGLAGAVLASEELAAEIICDGHHVHPAIVRMAIAAKHPSRVMAITDGTAGVGLPSGSRARLGGHAVIVRETGAYLEDGTLAGSVLTMDRAFRMLVSGVGLSLVDAAAVCATTPASELGLHGHGVIAEGSVADLVVLDRELHVVQTYIGGELAYTRNED